MAFDRCGDAVDLFLVGAALLRGAVRAQCLRKDADLRGVRRDFDRRSIQLPTGPTVWEERNYSEGREMKNLNEVAKTTEEALRIYQRIMAVTMSKLKNLSDEDCAEIRAVYVEEGLMDCEEAGHTCQTILAQRMADKFYDIPIAVAVIDGKCYGAYIGNWEPYELPAYDPMVATLAFEMKLFNDTYLREFNGQRVMWYMNKRHHTE
jgi:hypothetical protein